MWYGLGILFTRTGVSPPFSFLLKWESHLNYAKEFAAKLVLRLLTLAQSSQHLWGRSDRPTFPFCSDGHKPETKRQSSRWKRLASEDKRVCSSVKNLLLYLYIGSSYHRDISWISVSTHMLASCARRRPETQQCSCCTGIRGNTPK
jgi:hypothetical protein